ncbi:MAG: flagellar hook-basal body complex protein FliE [Candidatus Margulisbacteria bacterium]|nr:flagellar hook-basal body complex protein FliE [Candidatus Margulisiibacteriota bacterium]
MEDIAIKSNYSIGTISSLSDNKIGQDSAFSNMLKNNIQETNNLLNTADQYQYDFTVLRNRELHEVMIATEEANMALKFTMQVRNKVIEAYQELLRIQV